MRYITARILALLPMMMVVLPLMVQLLRNGSIGGGG